MSTIKNQNWFHAKDTQDLMSIFPFDTARFVGGCVRNALLDKPINDIDIATTLTPSQVISLIDDNSAFKYFETGLQHGTITLVHKKTGTPYEVTTLRKDVDTDGRHAEVEFVTDWAVDAMRRDFTINALYADFNGDVHDYVDGIRDIERRKVVFVGDADQRIKEDYLRILRFFRFHAYYGVGDFDMRGRAFCMLNAEGLAQISAERKTAELMKILSCPNTAMRKNTIQAMYYNEIMEYIIPNFRNLNRFYKIQAYNPKPILSIASMLPNHKETVTKTGYSMRLSAADIKTLNDCVIDDGRIILDETQCEYNIVKMGKEKYLNQLMLIWASMNTTFDQNILNKRDQIIDFVENYDVPVFPLKGQDLLDRGEKPGKELGRALHLMEERWIESDFTMTKEDLFDWYYNEMA